MRQNALKCSFGKRKGAILGHFWKIPANFLFRFVNQNGIGLLKSESLKSFVHFLNSRNNVFFFRPESENCNQTLIVGCLNFVSYLFFLFKF